MTVREGAGLDPFGFQTPNVEGNWIPKTYPKCLVLSRYLEDYGVNNLVGVRCLGVKRTGICVEIGDHNFRKEFSWHEKHI